jgi:drug/metabolite transporter (DMT)-like permease
LLRLDSANITQSFTPLAGFFIFMPPALLQWVWPSDLLTWILLVFTGLIGGFGHWLLVLAHRHAPAPILAPFHYVGLPSMVLLGLMVFADLPSWWTLVGAIIIISAGGYLLWREK